MLKQSRKTEVMNVAKNLPVGEFKNDVKIFLSEYFKFFIYCLLLIVPLYAITISILKHDWIMVIIDALIVPIGFVHGLLLLFGLFT